MKFKTVKFVDAVQYRGSVDPLRHFINRFDDAVLIYDQGDWCLFIGYDYGHTPMHKMDWLTRDSAGNYEVVSDSVFLLKYEPAGDKEY